MGASPYLSHLPLADVSSTLAKSTTPAVAGSMRRIPGVASRGSLRLPRAVFWRPFRALIPIANRQRPPWRAQFAAFPGLLPGVRYAYPGLCSGALSGRSFPSPIDNARRGGRLSPSHVINARAAGVFPPRMSLTPAPRASFPLAIYGEGVAVRPGVRSFPSLAFKPLDRAIVRLFLVVANTD